MTEPISMPWSAPVFGRPPHSWKGVNMAVFMFTPNAETVERILPPGFEAAEGLGTVTMLSYPFSQPPEKIHPFNELVVMIPVKVGEIEGNYVPYIYVTTDEAMIAGREISGWPKRMADITWERNGSQFSGDATRWGIPILSLEGEITAPVPEEFASQSQDANKPTLCYKLIPGPAGEIEIEEITLSQLDVVPKQVEMGNGRLHCENGDSDPLADLIPDCEGILINLVSDNTIPAGEVVKRIDRRVTA